MRRRALLLPRRDRRLSGCRRRCRCGHGWCFHCAGHAALPVARPLPGASLRAANRHHRHPLPSSFPAVTPPPATRSSKPWEALSDVCPSCAAHHKPAQPRSVWWAAEPSTRGRISIGEAAAAIATSNCIVARASAYVSSTCRKEPSTIFIPRSKGGGNTRYNRVLACSDCNGLKATSTPAILKELCVRWLHVAARLEVIALTPMVAVKDVKARLQAEFQARPVLAKV